MSPAMTWLFLPAVLLVWLLVAAPLALFIGRVFDLGRGHVTRLLDRAAEQVDSPYQTAAENYRQQVRRQ